MAQLFVKKHYEFFAKFIAIEIKKREHVNTIGEATLYELIDSFIAKFEDDAPKFKPELFRARIKQYIMGERELKYVP